MTYATYCSACDVGDCDNHHPGHIREGLIGGWRCVCDHDPERRQRRRERFLRNSLTDPTCYMNSCDNEPMSGG